MIDGQAVRQSMAIGGIQNVAFRYKGYAIASKGDWFMGGGGGFYCWAWDKPSENKHHLYRLGEHHGN